MNNAYTADLTKRIVNDVGIIKVDRGGPPAVSTQIGATKGPPKVTPDVQIENLDYDGKTVEIEGLDRKLANNCTIAFTMIQHTDGNIQMLEAGAVTTAVAEAVGPPLVPAHDKITPKETKAFYAAGDYIKNLRAEYPLGLDGTIAYVLPVALVTKYELVAENKGVGMYSVELRARLGAAAAATNDRQSPYHIEVYPPSDEV